MGLQISGKGFGLGYFSVRVKVRCGIKLRRRSAEVNEHLC